ncbi:Uu.00g065620.m01.CDS01 [Anthostomella pinea]|uniref:Iron-sulfur assembly protein 1 n=1 Tax=Anthostomella pinea TaxID=933095 RepID=A0AAI8YKT0_9PEZI|nr:Uu.00g065620.m01.CDS01 [Anthostomella pinea]
MNAPRMALPRASVALLSRLTTATTSSARPCQQILRQFSQTQPWAATSEKLQTSSSFQSYPLPSRPPSAPRNEPIPETSIASPMPEVHETRPPAQPTAASSPSTVVSEQEAQKPKPAPPKRKLRPRKAAMKLTSAAVEQMRSLLDQPEPKLIKVGVRNRGCSGLAYHLEYVDKPGKFDEEVEQDGVKVLIDSKALFSIIGSEMDWVEDKLNQRFVFRNPNIKEECGCGESFMV